MVDSTNLPEVDINQIATDLNNKMDRDGVNASCPTLLSRTSNSNGGVIEIWSDGYCVQTGYSASTNVTINLTQSYVNKNYNITLGKAYNTTTNSRFPNIVTTNTQLNSFYISGVFDNQVGTDCSFYWRTEGYIR